MAGNALAVDSFIRSFESLEEILELEPYRENNPLTKQSYHRLIGYYHLPVKIYCCLEKANGNLCKHEHGKGWVVEKTDGTYTLLGKDCANDKFGVDSKVIQDIRRAKNTISRQARLAKILKHLENQAQRTRELHEMHDALTALYARVQAFLNEVGPHTSRSLLDMHRSRSPQVVITAVKYREAIEDGRRRTERSAFKHRLGTLNGLAILARDSYTPIHVAINNVLAAFSAAAALEERPKRGEVDALASRLDEFDRVMNEGRALLACEEQFFANDMELLCFLVDDRAERYKCARRAIHQRGIAGGKDQAKVWLANREAALRKQLNVDQIEIR